MSKTLLVDGNNLLKIGFHGVREFYHNGKHVGGVWHFLNTLRKFLEEHNYNKVVVFWDTKTSSSKRRLIYPKYKLNRKPSESESKEESFLEQKQRVKQYLEEMFVRQLETEHAEADDLIALAKKSNLKFSIGYSQRFNPKFAYVKKSIANGTIGRPVSVLVSRHITRSLGKKITGRGKLSPAAMESTHDLDFVFWCLEPAKPVKVYSQLNFGAMRESTGAEIPDTQWITVTMDNGLSFVVGGGWSLPLGYPNFSTTWIEFIGTEGAVMVDDSHKDVVINTMEKGMQLPMSTMPGEKVDHVFAGPMAAENIHFIEAVAFDRPVLVTGEQARTVMEVYMAADLSAETGDPVYLPLPEAKLKAVAG